MDDIIEESESTAEERPECAVSYRYKVYRRPDLNHPVILRVRDYEHEVLESKGRIAGSCKMLDWTDWEVMVSNLFEKKYAEMTRLAAAGELEGCISSYARELNDQKKGIIESVKAENLGKEMEDFRIRDWSNDAAMALETDYPDTDGEVYEDGLMPDLVRSCQCERLTDGDAEALCREKRYIVPLPGKIDWKFLRREARRPLFRDPSEDGSAEQELMSADIRRLVALLLQAEYCRAMFAEAPDDGPELIGESYDPPEEKEVRQIEQSGRLARMELRRRICRAARLSDVTPEMAEHADGLIDRLLHSPGRPRSRSSASATSWASRSWTLRAAGRSVRWQRWRIRCSMTSTGHMSLPAITTDGCLTRRPGSTWRRQERVTPRQCTASGICTITARGPLIMGKRP